MDGMEPFKRGVLFTPPQGKKLLKRTWQKKYYALYQANNFGVERVEIFDSEEQFLRHSNPSKLIPLNDCIKVIQAPQKNQHNVFEVICRSQTHQFSAETTQELAEWISAFQFVAFGQMRRESCPYTIPSIRESLSMETLDIQQEDNLIYSSMSGPQTYTVKIVATDASERCGLHGSYQLTVTSLHISISQTLGNIKPNESLHMWPYRYIRRFKQTRGMFSFEAGRNCSSGEGFFTFETKEEKIIFQSVRMHIKSFDNDSNTSHKNSGKSEKSMRDSKRFSMINDIGGSSIPSAPVATERTHVKDKTASKNQSNPPDNIYENTLLSQGKLRPPIVKPPRKHKLPSTSSSAETVLTASDAASPDMSPLPSPLLPKEDFSKAFQSKTPPIPSPEEFSDLMYATPEERKDAWKTFALPNDNIHEETIPKDIAALYASVDVTNLSPKSSSYLKRHVSVPEVATTKESAIPFRQISLFSPRPRTSEGSYDHLFQFSSHAKNFANSDHVYKKLNSPTMVTSTDDLIYSSVPNEYAQPSMDDDETATTYATPVDAIDLNPADPTSSDADVKHMFQNNQVYSVVVKSKNNSLQ